MSRPEIVVSTVVWDQPNFEFIETWGRLWTDYLDMRLGNVWDCGWYYDLGGGCLLPDARNRAVERAFNNRPDFTHMMLIDSDVTGLRARDIKRMVEHDVPIVMPLVPLPSMVDDKPDRIACASEDEWAAVHAELKKGADAGLVEREWVGTGCTLIQRKVLEDTQVQIEDWHGKKSTSWFFQSRQPRLGYEREMSDVLAKVRNEMVGQALEAMIEGAEKVGKDAPMKERMKEIACLMGDRFESLIQETVAFGFELYNGGVPMGEDVTFGRRAGELGHKSYVDCGIACEHCVPRKHDLAGHLKWFGVGVDLGTTNG